MCVFVQVETVSLENGLEDWEMNLIQGIVSQLQMDTKTLKTGHNGKKNQINLSYKIMEVRINFYSYLHVLFCEYLTQKPKAWQKVALSTVSGRHHNSGLDCSPSSGDLLSLHSYSPHHSVGTLM
jgi:hypothetical protein